jgi:hypothetical protein
MPGRIDPWLKVEPRLDDITKMRKSGYKLEEIAYELGIHRKTLQRLSNKHESLSAALQRGRKELVVDIENALFKRALGGYVVTKTKVIEVPDRNDPTKMIIERRETTTEVLPPETGAIVWALRNLAPDRWQDKVTVESNALSTNLEVLKTLMEDKQGEETTDKPAEEQGNL